MAEIGSKFGLGGGGGVHFKDPWQFLPVVRLAADLSNEANDSTPEASSTTGFFTNMAARGLQDTTNWTANTYKTLLTVASGKGLVGALVGPTAGSASTTTFEITVDGVLTEIAIAVASGERAALIVGGGLINLFADTQRWAQQNGALDAGKTTLQTFTEDMVIPSWTIVTLLGTPLLIFKQSLLIRAKHSADITNSTATAYSGVMYRLGL